MNHSTAHPDRLSPQSRPSPSSSLLTLSLLLATSSAKLTSQLLYICILSIAIRNNTVAKARQKMSKLLPFCTIRSLISPVIYLRSCEAIVQNSRLVLDPIGAPYNRAQIAADATSSGIYLSVLGRGPVPQGPGAKLIFLGPQNG